MSTSDDQDGAHADEPVTLDELASLAAGELSEPEEERLRMRLQRDPAAQAQLERLRLVERYLPRPSPLDLPADMPEDMAARLEAHVEREVKRFHADTEHPGPAESHDTDDDPGTNHHEDP